jgi:hypothetical protein
MLSLHEPTSFSHDHMYVRSGGGRAVNVLLHLLTCSMLRFRRLLHMITHTFGWGLLTSFCTCSHVRCYASDVFFTWSHISSPGGAVNVLLSCYAVHVFFTCLYIPPTSFMLRCTCLLSISSHNCASRSHVSCYAVDVFFTWLYITRTSFTPASFMLQFTCLLLHGCTSRKHVFFSQRVYITLKSFRDMELCSSVEMAIQ